MSFASQLLVCKGLYRAGILLCFSPFVVMTKKLTPQQLAAAAETAGFEPRAVRAIIKVETGGSGYDRTTGYLLIQFEPSWFRRLLPKDLRQKIASASATVMKRTATAEQITLTQDWAITQANKVEGQVRERQAFDAACRIDRHTAYLATSWGLPQMMGFNYKSCGYSTVEEMIEGFRQSEAKQLAAMLLFIKSKPPMATALKNRDWGVLAYHYNGAGYKVFKYDKKLGLAYEALA
ncbi:N-acetylmuramidase family protein [Hymenobacter volaticus]|uniref:N-acetylmuramidase family protein n=1 Tax=Hymenobacter volaticus TaxID=2932254 RepID=A0ABY4GDR2_9BACT|nr:N-acetylmuramidase family protein [Hymenobacter volaticus]UOQ69051.1 N-acetylmuramidase family protein [Hymenobacter volaticus]